MGRDALDELWKEFFTEALEIGSDNWDNYLSGNRWPELEASEKYQKLRKIMLDKTPKIVYNTQYR
jgi:hypothetical protein